MFKSGEEQCQWIARDKAPGYGLETAQECKVSQIKKYQPM
jgi:hypothetical protein